MIYRGKWPWAYVVEWLNMHAGIDARNWEEAPRCL